jgi:ATP-dependent Zn protease
MNTGHHDDKDHGTDHKENTEHGDSDTEESNISTEHEGSGSNHEQSSDTAQPGNFYIILGSFSERVNAEGLAERMVMEGHSHASVIERNGNYSVIFNKYNSKDDAKAELSEARTIAKNAWVLTAE